MIDALAAQTATASPRALGAPAPPPAQVGSAALRETAQAFEAAFLAEMLNHTGLARPTGALGGSSGADAFGSLMVREYAGALAERGGLGLSDRIYAALIQRSGHV